MQLFPRSKHRNFFSVEENDRIVEAIRDTEKRTSGEIRVFMESRCRFVDPLDRAAQIFWNLKMDQTTNRNSVLIYIAVKDRQFAIFADKGIHEKLGADFWQKQIHTMGTFFRNESYGQALLDAIRAVGSALQFHFPYDAATDKNELPDDIVFGK